MEVRDKIEIVEHYISRGSVPSVPRSVGIELKTEPRIITVLRKTVTSNVLFSLASFVAIALHLGTLAAPMVSMAAVILHHHGRGQTLTGGSGTHSFVPLHLYFVATSGSDSNDGLAPTAGGGHGPWATPNHSVVCGDVILVQPTSWGSSGAGSPFTAGNWGNVSNCPSTTAGIDGTGGIYAAVFLCAGSDLMSCPVNGFGGNAIWPTRSTAGGNWSVQGFLGTQDANASDGTCFSAENDTDNGGTNTTLNYLIWSNDIASTCDLGGFGVGSDSYPSGSWDHVAAMGLIAWNTAVSTGGGGGICGSNMSLIVAPSGSDPGTHTYTAGFFSYFGRNSPSGNVCPTGTFNSDGEGIIWDSIAESTYNHQVVVEQSVLWQNGSACIMFFPAGNTAGADQAQYYAHDNTCVTNMADPQHVAGAELYLNGVSPTTTGVYHINNNIFLNPYICPGGIATCTGVQDGQCDPGNTGVCAAAVTGYGSVAITSYSSLIDISGNYIFDSHVPTSSSTGGNNTWVGDAGGTHSWVFGTNTYVDPGLANISALPITAPNCTGYRSVFACMNAAGVIADVANSTGVGYKPPGPCGPNTYFPTWAKGLDHLEASGFTLGATITEVYGNINRPCNM